ncbi:MAG TPA: hypothetical protein VHB98_09165 [Chloroflexota bacterium]|jgi:hypothetical protein|nr:hypothetical protein [Chloroflexota bacterium]
MPLETNKAMDRRHLLRGAAALGALAAIGSTGIVGAAETEAAGSSPVGAWMLNTESGGSKSVDLFAFTKDGLVIDSGGVPLKAPPAGQSSPITIGLGTWANAAAGGFNVTFVSLGAGANGAFQGTSTISAHVLLGVDGNSFHGQFKVTVEAGGKVVFTESGTVTATRIKPAM